jgi:O-antigen/teichoic acid export membrane protein
LWRFIGYYGMSELAQRVTRIATTVLLARLLVPLDLGIAAMAITCFELLRVGTNAGIGQAVIRATDAQLAGTCITGFRLMWAICGALALIQLGVGTVLAIWSDRSDVFFMIAALASVYLMMAPGLIQTYLIQRANGHRVITRIATQQAVADNVLTIAFALAGFGAWSIVLPKIVTCPIWLLGMRRAHVWNADPKAEPAPVRDVLQYALPVLGAEITTAARLQLDKVLVGMMLGIEALGVYYFIFNAGIGLSLSLTVALSNVLYPHFAAVAAAPALLLQRLDRSLLQKALPFAAIILLQAALAPIYVPILFGAKWEHSAWLVAVLCVSAAAKLFADAGTQALRAAGATIRELQGTFVVTVVSLSALATALRYDLATAVVVLAVVSALTQLAFAAMARQVIAALSNRESIDASEVSA